MGGQRARVRGDDPVAEIGHMARHHHQIGADFLGQVHQGGFEVGGKVVTDFRMRGAGPGDRAKLIEAVEAMSIIQEGAGHPQGAKVFNGKTHQVFGHQYISRVEGGKLVRVHSTSIEDTFYPDEVDYTAQPL